MGLFPIQNRMVLTFRKDQTNKHSSATLNNKAYQYSWTNIKSNIRRSTKTNLISENNESNKKQKKRNQEKKEQKKKIVAVQPLIIPSTITGDRTDIDVSKKGGKFLFAGGLELVIEDGSFPKKITISSTILPPNKRQDFPLELEYQDYLASEIFVVCSKVFSKKPIHFFIPTIVEMNQYCCLMCCSNDKMEWNSIDTFTRTEKGISFNYIEWGLFAIVKRKPFHEIVFSRNGGLFYPHIHPLASLRLPRTACPIEHECFIQLFDSDKETIDQLTTCYPADLSNILNMSSMFSFSFPLMQFKRPMTIKLPVPDWAESILESSDTQRLKRLLLCIKREGCWDPMETPLYFTKNSFSFDTKLLGTFVLIEPKPNREGRIKQSLAHLEYINNIKKGMIIVFLWLETKSWYLWVELVEESQLGPIRQSREEAGLIFIEQTLVDPNENSIRENKRSIRSRRKSVILPSEDCSRIVELSDGLTFTIRINGDIKIKPISLVPPIVSKQFHKMLMAILKRQSQVNSQQMQSFIIDDVDDENDEDDDDMNFLSKIGGGGKKPSSGTNDETILQTVESNSEENFENTVNLIYYSKMEANYRIIEIEPIKSKNINVEIIERVKQKIIINEDYNMEINEEFSEDFTLTTIKKESDISSTNMSDTLISKHKSIHINTDLLKAQTAVARQRIKANNEKMKSLMFNISIKVRRNSSSIQVPPNQLMNEINFDKAKPKITEEIKRQLLNSYLIPDLLKNKFKFNILIDPDEMREYIGLSKPHSNDILTTRYENEQSMKNPYLQNIDLEIKNDDLIKNKAISKLIDKSLINKDTPIRNSRPSQSAIYKEPKVLSGKSLQVLSLYIEQGLTLAVHLNIPDSTITGIGFDSLSSNLTLAEVSYKVLLFWKKQTRGNSRPMMLNTLIQGLNNMNLKPIAKLVQTCGEKNEELTREMFDENPDILKLVKQNIDPNALDRMIADDFE